MTDGAASRLSQASIRTGNAWHVLQAVRTEGLTSRARIAEQTGLTLTTVHRLTDDLRRRRLIIRAGISGHGGAGRPSSLFRFNATVGHVVGVDLGNETTRVVLADLTGAELGREECPSSSVDVDLLGRLESIVSELQGAARVRADTLVGVGVGVAAVTGAEGTIVRPSMHRPWEGIHLGSQLRSHFGCDVFVAQDDHLAALGELNHGACVGLRSALVVDVGKGMGAGIIADGQVYSGHHWAAGRLAWIPYPIDGRGPAMLPIGQLLTADGLLADYRQFGGSMEARGAVDVFIAAEDQDRAALRAIDVFADRLGWLIATAVSIIDPQRVVVGGGISGSFERLEARVAARVREIVPAAPPVVASPLGTRAVATGAIDAAIQIADGWMRSRIGA
jgi:predicted NBD/HSP70 family sugar kinase